MRLHKSPLVLRTELHPRWSKGLIRMGTAAAHLYPTCRKIKAQKKLG